MAEGTGTALDYLPQEQQPWTPPAWEDVQEHFQNAFPGMDSKAVGEAYNQQRKLTIARSVAAAQPEEGLAKRMERMSIPIVSNVEGVRRDVQYGRAKQRLEAGQPLEGDYQTVAHAEEQQRRDAQRTSTMAGHLGDVALQAPAFLGELALGGGVVGAAAKTAAVQGAKVAVPKLAAAGAGLAARTAFVPSLYARQWTQGNIQAGRDPLDPRGFPAAFALGMLQNAVIGHAQKAGAGLIPQAGAGAFLARQGLKGAIGVGEQQAADVASTLVSKVFPAGEALDTRYGLLGSLARGEKGEALRHATGQFLTFAAFGAMHEGLEGTPAQRAQAAREQAMGVNLGTPAGDFGPQRPPEALGYRKPQEPAQGRLGMAERGQLPEPPHPVLKAFVDFLDDHGRRGGSRDGAATACERSILRPLNEALEQNPNLNREQARALFGDMKEGKLKDLALAVADTFPPLAEVPPGQRQIGQQERPLLSGPGAGKGTGRRMTTAAAEDVFGPLLRGEEQPALPAPETAPAAAPESPEGKRDWFGRPVEETPPEPAPAPEPTPPTPPPAEPAKPSLVQQRQALYERLLKEGRSKPSAAAEAEARFPLAEGETPLYPHGPKQEVPSFTPPEATRAETRDLGDRLASGLGQGVKNPKRAARLKEKMRQKAAQPPQEQAPTPEPAPEPVPGPKLHPRAEEWAARLKTGLSLRKVAEESGVSYETVRRAVKAYREANGEQGTDATASAAAAASRAREKAENEQLQNVEGMQRVGRDKTKAYWDEEARKVGLDREELHGRVADEIAPEQQALRHLTDLLRELRASLKSFDPEKKARNFRHEKYQDPDSIAHLDEVVTQYRDRLQQFARPGEELTDTAYRLLHEGVDLETRRADKYQQVFNELLDREEQREREKARRDGLAEGAIEETVRAGESAGEAEEVAGPGEAEEPAGGDTSFDFGANEPELKPLGKKEFPLGPGERPGVAPPPVSTEQPDLFGGPSKNVQSQGRLFGPGEIETSQQPEPARPVDERQQALFGPSEAPEDLKPGEPPRYWQGKPYEGLLGETGGVPVPDLESLRSWVQDAFGVAGKLANRVFGKPTAKPVQQAAELIQSKPVFPVYAQDAHGLEQSYQGAGWYQLGTGNWRLKVAPGEDYLGFAYQEGRKVKGTVQGSDLITGRSFPEVIGHLEAKVAEKIAPAEVDWRPNETIPEDFYAYRHRQPSRENVVQKPGQFKGLVLDFLRGEEGHLDLKRLGELGKNLWEGIKNSSAADWLRSFAQQQFPTLTRLARPSGEALAEAANSKAAAKAAWDYFANKLTVGPEGKRLAQLTPEERRLIGAVWWEMRARHYADVLRRRGQSAEDIGSLIGQEGSPLPDEATFTREQERLKPFFEQVKAEWTPAVEANFKDIKGLDPEDEIHSPSQIPGLPMNAIPLTEGEATLGAVRTGKSQSMQNLKLSNPAFTKKAALSAPAYDLDVANMMQRTLNLGVPAAARARFARQALADGILVKVGRGESLPDSKEYTYLGLDPNHGLPGLEPNARYYVKNDAFREVVQGLGIGERPGQTLASGLRPVMDRIYNLALTSPVELMTHVGNHVTALFRPGMGIPLANLRESFANAWKVMQKDPEILKKVWDLARIGAGFEHEANRPGLLGEKLKTYDPTAILNRFTGGIIDVMQKAVRLQLGDAFDRLADAGHFPKTETAKRNFINQALGNYSSQASNRLAQFLKDTGLQSFATAAHTFTTQGLKAGLGGAINAPATSGQAALQLRAQALLKLLPVLALAPVANYLLHKESFPEDVPAFAIKTREGEEGKVHYFDPLRFTGIRRGWRGLGINALIEGGRNGEPAGKILDRASRDFLMTGEHLFAGPPVQALHTLMTGENALGHKVAGKPQPGESKYYQNLKATALGVNPVVASLTQADQPKNPRTLAENLAQSAGPFGETTRDQRRPAPVQNYYSFLGELNDLRRDSPERRAGKLFPQERTYRVLEAYKSAIDRLDHAIRGEVVRPTGVIQGPKPSPERVQQLRKQQADLAKRALAAIGR